MGFFQDLKEDLSQAVTELMEDEVNDVTKKASDGEEMIGEPMEEVVEEAEEESDDEIIGENEEEPTEAEVEAMFKAELGIADTEEASLELTDMNSEVEEITKDETADEDSEAMMNSLLYDIQVSKEKTEKVESTMLVEEYTEEYTEEAVDETAVITKGMNIKGDVKSKGSIDIIGSIEGDIDILGKLNVTGSIKGNSKAAEVFADAAKVVGEIHTEGTVKIGASSIIIGNITATCAVIAGAVKGDIDVQGPVVLDTSAIVMGNIKSKSVQINNGAVIEGLCSQCYADVNPINFFDEFK